MDSNDELYKEASARYGAAIKRLARGYEAEFAFSREALKVKREIEKLGADLGA